MIERLFYFMCTLKTDRKCKNMDDTRLLIDDDALQFAESILKDPSPFTCDLSVVVANIDSLGMGSCDLPRPLPPSLMADVSIEETFSPKSGSDEEGYQDGDDEYQDDDEEEADEDEDGQCSSLPSAFSPVLEPIPSLKLSLKKKMLKKKAKKRMTPVSCRLYICDWCEGRASFKSCQGLRFHKTIRCPSRHQKLGKEFFKCDRCRKAYVSEKGLRTHILEAHNT